MKTKNNSDDTVELPQPWTITGAGMSRLETILTTYTPAVQAEAWEEYVTRKADEANGLRIENGIAIQPVSGCIIAGIEPEYEYFCGCFNLDRIRAAVERVQGDGLVRGFILAVDSPGGYSKGMGDAVAALTELREARPDIATAAWCDEACSAGYWLAAAAGPIHAAPEADMGSIGVYVTTYDYSKMAQQNGIHVRLFADGKFKGMGTPGVEWKPEWYEWVQQQVDSVSASFKGFVRANRPGIEDDTMQGQFFSGPQYPAGLVDSTEHRSLSALYQKML